jgi:uncharacterized protein
MKQYLKANDIKRCLANTPQITFEITDACNLRCEYCGYGKFYSDYDERKNQMLPTEKATRFLDYLIELWSSPFNTSTGRNVYISFYGGEPLMNFPFIKEVVNHLETSDCKTRQFTFSMTTNAILLDRYMDYLVEKRFNLLISLDGNEYNTSYRVDNKRENAFDRIVKNVDLLKKKYPKYFEEHVDFNAVLHNRNSVESIYSFFKERYNKIPTIGELNSSGIREDMIPEFEKTYKNSTESLLQSEHYSEIEKDMFLRSPTYQSATVFLMQHSEFKYKNYNELNLPEEVPSIFKSKKIHKEILITFPLQRNETEDVIRKYQQIQNVKFHFFIEDEVQYRAVNEFIDRFDLENINIVPIYTGKNDSFFTDNIFLEKEDIFSSIIDLRQIFRNQKLNSNDFGFLTVLPNGDVKANINREKLGNVYENPILELLYKELIENTAWRKIRNQGVCKSCLYQFLCPSPSNYEIVIGKPNLCHIQP